MEDPSGWLKPFIASFIVLGLTLLVAWLIIQYYINKIDQKISNVTRYVNGLITPAMNYFVSVSRYAATSSDKLSETVMVTGQKFTDSIASISDPAKAASIARYLQEKTKLNFKADKLAEQSKLNQKIAETATDDLAQQKDIKDSLDRIDEMLSKSIGNPTIFRDNVSDFTMSLLRALMPSN